MITKSAAAVALAILTGCASIPAPESIGELTMRPLGPGAWLVVHAVPHPSNSLLVEMKDGTLVLVRTPYTEQETRSLLTWMESRFGRRPRMAINTHFHWDALGGNGALIEQGIPVYGSSETARLLAERGEAMRTLMLDFLKDRPGLRDHFRDARLVPPDHRFEPASGCELRFGAETVRILFPGPGHSPDNVVVYFPERRLLHGGCLILAGERVGNRSDADLAAWPAAIRSLQRLDVDLVIPGHGEPGNASLLTHTLEVLERSR